MSYKQNLKHIKNPPLASLQDLHPSYNQKILIRTWQEYKVSQPYQQIVLSFLDAVQSQSQLLRQLSRQIKATHERDNHYFHIQHFLHQRSQAIEHLFQEIHQLQYYKENQGDGQIDLERVCDILDYIRKMHLLISQETYQMFTFYRCNIKTSTFPKHYLEMFKVFDGDLQFLREGLLQDYIPFSKGYDPLLLQPLKLIKEGYLEGRLIYDEHVAQLFNVNPSYMYRMLRAHQRMLSYISYAQDQHEDVLTFQYHKDRRTQSYKEVPIKLISYQEQRPMRRQDSSRIRLRRLEEQHKFQKQQEQSRRQQEQLRRIKRQQQSRKRRLQQEKDKLRKQQQQEQYRLRRHEHESKRKQTIKIVHSLNYNYKPSSSLPHDHLLRQVKQIKPIVELANRKVLKLAPQYYFNLKKQGRTKTEEIKDEVTRRRNASYKRFSPIMGNSQENSRIQQNELQLSPPDNKDKKSRFKKLPNIKIQSRLQSNSTPHNHSRVFKTDHEDFLYRQKHRENNMKSHSDDIDQVEASEQRKQIIKNIKMKYRALAEKQMRYLIAKVGGKVYHQMKNKQKQKSPRNIKSKVFY